MNALSSPHIPLTIQLTMTKTGAHISKVKCLLKGCTYCMSSISDTVLIAIISSIPQIKSFTNALSL